MKVSFETPGSDANFDRTERFFANVSSSLLQVVERSRATTKDDRLTNLFRFAASVPTTRIHYRGIGLKRIAWWQQSHWRARVASISRTRLKRDPPIVAAFQTIESSFSETKQIPPYMHCPDRGYQTQDNAGEGEGKKSRERQMHGFHLTFFVSRRRWIG